MNAKTKLVVVWGGEDVVSISIKHFLTIEKNLEVVNVVSEEQLEALLLGVGSTHSDLVIIQQKGQNGQTKTPLQLLQEHPNIKVIQFSLESNMMDLYSKQEVVINRPIDLIALI